MDLHHSDPGNPPGIIDTRSGAPEDDETPRVTKPRASRAQLVAAGVAGAALSLSAVFGVALTGHSSSANAAVGANTPPTTVAGAPQHVRHGVGGTVTAISGNTLTVKANRPRIGRGRGCDPEGTATQPTTYKVTTTGATRFAELAPGKVSDLGKGDTVVVLGKASGDTVAAHRIVQTPGDRAPRQKDAEGHATGSANGRGPDQSSRRRRVRPMLGTITAVSGSTLTVKTLAGKTVKVTTTSTTKVTVMQKASISSISVGEHIRARGTVSGTTVAADAIMIGTPPKPPRSRRLEGGPPPAGGHGATAPSTTS